MTYPVTAVACASVRGFSTTCRYTRQRTRHAEEDTLSAHRTPRRSAIAACVLVVATVLALASVSAPPASALTRVEAAKRRQTAARQRVVRIDRARRARIAKLHSAGSWAFAIGDGATVGTNFERLKSYDIVVVDGETTSAEQIEQLHAAGCSVLAYVSVGTIESYRSWYPRVAPYRLDLWGDWGEWYADVNAAGYRTVLLAETSTMLGKGADGLFLDNVDMVDVHPERSAGMTALVTSLSAQTRRAGRVLATQNGYDVVWPLRGFFSAWNREDVTSTYDFETDRYLRTPAADREDALRELGAMRAAGLVTMATDYTSAEDTATGTLARQNAASVGALSFVSDILLTRIPALP